MIISDDKKLQEILDAVRRELMATNQFKGGAYLTTPLLYPNGTSVVVRIDEGRPNFFVSDMGLGAEEADLMGGSRIYSQTARKIADAAGIRFDNRAFFVVEASKEQLPGAIATVANCSQEAVNATAYKIADRKHVDHIDRLYARLARVFTPEQVARDVEIRGASSHVWHVATMVRADSKKTIFEPVSKNHNSVFAAATKFGDIARLELAPRRISVVQSKKELGTYLSILSQTSSIVEENVADATLHELAEAA